MKHAQHVLRVEYYVFTYLENQYSIYYGLKSRRMQTRIISCTMLSLKKSKILVETFNRNQVFLAIDIGERNTLFQSRNGC
jgi:hypothetical protein